MAGSGSGGSPLPWDDCPREEVGLPHAAHSVEDVTWVTALPEDLARVRVPIISPRAGRAPLRGWVVSSRAVACWVHWYGERSGPCLAPKKLCDGCRTGCGKRLYGYLAVAVPRARLCLLEATAEAIRPYPSLLSGNESYRGAGFTASRAGEHAQSRMVLALTAPTPGGIEAVAAWPEPLDLKPLLARVWGMQG